MVDRTATRGQTSTVSRPTHPLDALLQRPAWRRFTASAAIGFALGAVLATLAVFDLSLVQQALMGTPYDRDWDDLMAATVMGRRVMATSLAGLALGVAMWAVAAWVDAEGGAYWLRRSRQARELLRKRGRPDPERHRLARAALELEDGDGGWRPETVLVFLEATRADARAPVERAWLDELRAWSVATRIAADDALRRPGAVHPVEIGGTTYDAEDVATLTERIDRALLDLRFRDA